MASPKCPVLAFFIEEGVLIRLVTEPPSFIQLKLVHYYDSSEQHLTNFKEHSEWKLKSFKGEVHVTTYEGYVGGFPELIYTIHLERDSDYMTYVFILPAFVMSFLVPVVFLLPPESPGKIVLGNENVCMVKSIRNSHLVNVLTSYYLFSGLS